jgi:hypothetical protein
MSCLSGYLFDLFPINPIKFFDLVQSLIKPEPPFFTINEFFPVLIYNNRKGGPDEKHLRRFQEPAWNYQVIRFFNAEGRDVIPRKDRIWTTSGVASRMIEAMRAANRPVPEYLNALTKAEN